MQVLQGAARLGDHDFRLVPDARQRGPGCGNLSNKVTCPAIQLSTLQGVFRSLQVRLHTGGLAGRQRQHGRPHPQRGPRIQHGDRECLQPAEDGDHSTKVQGQAHSVYQSFRTFNLIGGSRVLEGAKPVARGCGLAFGYTCLFIA